MVTYVRTSHIVMQIFTLLVLHSGFFLYLENAIVCQAWLRRVDLSVGGPELS